MTAYTNAIRHTLALQGRLGAHDPRIVEAWMRLEHGTLDGLGRVAFQRAVGEAMECADASTRQENESLAGSFGL